MGKKRKTEKGTVILTNKHYGSHTLYDANIRQGLLGDPDKVDLHYSDLDNTWTRPGELSSKLKCTGNGYVFSSYNINGEKVKTLEFDYCQAQELRILLKLMEANESDNKFSYVKR